MDIDIITEDERWNSLGLDALAAKAFDAAAVHLGLAEDVEAVVLACDDERIAELNAEFRQKSAATNVLSWPSAERASFDPGGPPTPPDEPELGDIAISYDTCTREAREQNKRMDDHVTHLLVHGLLHLLGYDHENEKDAALMEGLEVEILGKLGLSDPYGVTGA
ncbi:rRNA maturation RNase YbeY [Maritimibacter dapengensis]|uniref:Endoribonuclease YbeY n=1 Tax=Maritimibacter dapengensis TaxID=2836868 RepID=A0ABS6SZZ3_9RHOB|nr:rRNA maturation RNase YbeY [Maritimibacter dapengensis]MBV7378546.1 rRNA maturation RNase YbeY [Maritimibacter dapengensis]